MNSFILQAAGLMAITLSLSVDAAKFDCDSERGYSPYPYVSQADLNHEQFAPASNSTFIKRFSAYTAVFDTDDDDNGDGIGDLTANVSHVMYHMKGLPNTPGQFQEPGISIDRPRDWYKSKELIDSLASQPGVTASRIDNSYDGIGNVWNRGHWAMADHAERISAQASCNTHHYWNGSPHAASLNQGDWLHLETYTAALSNIKGDVWVITGPIFYKGQPMKFIGDKGEIPVAVPDALFKVIIFSESGNLNFYPFIYDQKVEIAKSGKYKGKPISTGDWVKCSSAKKQNHTYDRDRFLVSLRDIESQTDLRFFPNMNPELRNQIIDYEPPKTTKIEDRYWSARYCMGNQ